jgi:hypothetical protein
MNELMYRYNLVMGDTDSNFLDQLAEEIREATGAKVSRSEIVRAAIAGLRELHRLAPDCPSRFPALTHCRSGEDLAMLTVLAARCATQERV